jgi:MinD-like ATPase involved in chromosome partitioning or flagellar assembly
MLIAVCCDRGAPGSTTTALALGSAFPEQSIVVEADPYGGDLALRCRVPGGGVLPETPTVLTVAVAARTSKGSDLVSNYAHPFTEFTRLIPGHMAAEQAGGLSDWSPLAKALHSSLTHIVADLGRIHANSPSLPIAAAADVLVVVARADMGSVVHLRDRLNRLVPAVAEVRGRPPVLVPVVVAPRRTGPQHAAEIRELLADTAAGPVTSDVGWIAWDPAGVERLEQGESGGRGLDRTPLMRSAAGVVEQIVAAAGQRSPWNVEPIPSEAL